MDRSRPMKGQPNQILVLFFESLYFPMTLIEQFDDRHEVSELTAGCDLFHPLGRRRFVRHVASQLKDRDLGVPFRKASAF
jgi:hypothetical protein